MPEGSLVYLLITYLFDEKLDTMMSLDIMLHAYNAFFWRATTYLKTYCMANEENQTYRTNVDHYLDIIHLCKIVTCVPYKSS